MDAQHKGQNKNTHLSDYERVRHPPRQHPLRLLEWVQAVQAVALYQERNDRGSCAHREAVRKTCSTLSKVLPGLVLAAARGEELDGVDLDGPPPVGDPLKISLYTAHILVEALDQVISNTWGRDDNYERLCRLRQHARTTIQVLSPEIELESRDRLRRRSAKLVKRGEPPPLAPLDNSGQPCLRSGGQNAAGITHSRN